VPEVPVHLSVVGYRVEWMSLECTALTVTVSIIMNINDIR